MNKLVIDKEKLLDNYEGFITTNNSTIIVKGHCIINEIFEKDYKDIKIILKEDSVLEYNRFSFNPCNKGSINIEHEKNSQIIFNESIVCDKDFNLDLDVSLPCDNIKNVVRIRLVAENDSDIKIRANGKILKNTVNNEILEDLRCFNFDNSDIKILPNLIVDSNDVIANHNATISNISEEQLFYLNSKGLDKKSSISLLKQGFILSLFADENVKNEIKKYL